MCHLSIHKRCRGLFRASRTVWFTDWLTNRMWGRLPIMHRATSYLYSMRLCGSFLLSGFSSKSYGSPSLISLNLRWRLRLSSKLPAYESLCSHVNIPLAASTPKIWKSPLFYHPSRNITWVFFIRGEHHATPMHAESLLYCAIYHIWWEEESWPQRKSWWRDEESC